MTVTASPSSSARLDKTLHGWKRYYVGPFFGINMAAGVVAAVHALRGGSSRAAWFTAAATHAAVVAHAPRGWPRRDSGPASMLGIATIGTAAAASLPGGRSPAARLALLAFGGAAAYLGWYGSFGRTPSPALTVGRRLPEVALRRADGSTLMTSELAGRPAALFFTRGNWCPFCTAQIQQLVADYHHLAERGVTVVVISSQPEAESQALADQFGVDIIWTVDPGLAATTTLGITDPGGVPAGIPPHYGLDTVMPTLVVIDAEQIVLGAEETDNFRIRPDASTVMSILDGAPGAPAAATPASINTAAQVQA